VGRAAPRHERRRRLRGRPRHHITTLRWLLPLLLPSAR
jgi:hypothetical protein